MSALLTTAVDAKAILPAVVVVKIPVGISVIWPPVLIMGLGGVIVAIAVVPETKTILFAGAIVVDEAIVGATFEVANNPTTACLTFIPSEF
jgi:hypothetical protein